MSINKTEILSLPDEEKIALAEELWSSVEEHLRPVTEYELAFARERLNMHEASTSEGMSLDSFKKYFAEKYGL